MTLALSADQLQTLRSDPQSARLGLLVFRAPIIVRARVDHATSQARGETAVQVIFDEVLETPDYHYTVIIGSTEGGDDGGKLRFKTMNLDSKTIWVSSNSIEWDNYDHISVLRVIDPKSVLPNLANTLMDGNVAYVDQNERQYPLAHIGPPAWGYVGETIKFYSDSRPVASGATIVSHLWTFPNGSIESSTDAGSAETPIEVSWDYPTGHVPHYIKYRCVDSNGKAHTRYNPVWILENFTDSYCMLEAESLSGSFSAGTWSTTLNIFGPATTAEFPRDAMVMVIAEDYYNHQKVSVGNRWKYRDNILFVGWTTKATTLISDKDSVRIEATGPMGILSKMTGWPANLKDGNPHIRAYVAEDGVPDPTAADMLSSKWDNIPGMTCDLAVHHLITQRTNIDNVVDVWLTGSTRRLRYVDIPEGSMATQLNDYCLSPIGASAISDAHGSIYCDRNPNLMALSERDVVQTVCTLQLSDILEDPGAEMEAEQYLKAVAQVDFIGFFYNGGDVDSYYSLAPPYQFESGDIKKIDGIRADSQAEANELAGMYLANENNQWRQIRLPMLNMRVFDIAPQAYTIFPIEASQNLRGIDWSFGQKLIARDIEYSYDPEVGSIMTTVSFEADSFGPPGVGGGYPKKVPKQTKTTVTDKQALAAWGSFWYNETGQWEYRGELKDVLHGCVDLWWRDISKADSRDPNFAWHWACGANGFLATSQDGGFTWNPLVLPFPDNSWADNPAPTLTGLSLIQVCPDKFRNGRFYLSANQTWYSNRRGWIGITEDNFTSITWVAPFNPESPPTELTVLWVDANQAYVFATVVDGESLKVIVLNASTYEYIAEFMFGSATFSQVLSREIVAFPVTMVDNIEEVHVAGRFLSYPEGADGVYNVVRRDSAGDWHVVAQDWTGMRRCVYLQVERSGSNLLYYAVKE